MKKDKRQKFGGRKKGTPNKDTKELREKISDLIDNNFKNIQSDIDNLESKERLDFLVKLFEYSLPKLNRTEIKTDTGNIYDQRPFHISDIYKRENVPGYEDENELHPVTKLVNFEK